MTLHKSIICFCCVAVAALTASAVAAAKTAPKGLILVPHWEVGYYIEILKSESITVKTDTASTDPLHTVTGCGPVTIATGFQCQLTARAQATSAAGGTWTATVRPSLLAKGTTLAKICVTGKGVNAANLAAGSKIKVAQVVVTVIPH
jgi:hypothetical protein